MNSHILVNGREAIEHARTQEHGFLSEVALHIIAIDNETRFHPVLVRCGCGRFTVPAQDAQHFVDIINQEGSDYVRDVSLLAQKEG